MAHYMSKNPELIVELDHTKLNLKAMTSKFNDLHVRHENLQERQNTLNEIIINLNKASYARETIENSQQPSGSKSGLRYGIVTFMPSTIVNESEKIPSVTLEKPDTPKVTVDKGKKKVERTRGTSNKSTTAGREKPLVSTFPSKARASTVFIRDSKREKQLMEKLRVQPKKAKANQPFFQKKEFTHFPDRLFTR